MERRRARIRFIATVALFALSGSISSVMAKTILTPEFRYKYDLKLQFKKPYFQTLLSFIGPTCLLVITFLQKPFDWRETGQIMREIGLAAVLNAFATCADFYCLMYMPTAVWKTFHNWQILFSCVFALATRRSRLHFTDWVGLFLVVVGICGTGVSGLIRSITFEISATSHKLFSYILVIIAGGAKSIEIGIEENVIKSGKASPLELTAFKGIWGLWITLFIIIPLASSVSPTNPIYESISDISEYTSRSPTLVSLEIVFVLISCVYSYLSYVVVEQTSADARFAYEAASPYLVLLISWISYYATGINSIGEQLDSYGIGELIGITVSLIGTLIYMKIITFPCFSYSDDKYNTRIVDLIPSNLRTTRAY